MRLKYEQERDAVEQIHICRAPVSPLRSAAEVTKYVSGRSATSKAVQETVCLTMLEEIVSMYSNAEKLRVLPEWL